MWLEGFSGPAIERQRGADHIADVVILAEELLCVGGDFLGRFTCIEYALEAVVDTELVIGVEHKRGFFIDDEVVNASFGGGDNGAGTHCRQQEHIEAAGGSRDNEDVGGRAGGVEAQ
ncbi:MAG: hypothetical protein MUP16_05350 [Sedimentisphaerales bacterium]|nr:hypothetical protein [Sedimentisphaerales bacterium]